MRKPLLARLKMRSVYARQPSFSTSGEYLSSVHLAVHTDCRLRGVIVKTFPKWSGSGQPARNVAGLVSQLLFIRSPSPMMSLLPTRRRASASCPKRRSGNLGGRKGTIEDKHQHNDILWIRRFSGALFGFWFGLRTDAIFVPPIDFHWQLSQFLTFASQIH